MPWSMSFRMQISYFHANPEVFRQADWWVKAQVPEGANHPCTHDFFSALDPEGMICQEFSKRHFCGAARCCNHPSWSLYSFPFLDPSNNWFKCNVLWNNDSWCQLQTVPAKWTLLHPRNWSSKTIPNLRLAKLYNQNCQSTSFPSILDHMATLNHSHPGSSDMRWLANVKTSAAFVIRCSFFSLSFIIWFIF